MHHQPFSQSSLPLPNNEEWSIIYKHRAQQMQKAQSLQKAMNQQKKDKLKSQLDHQIASKRNNNNIQKEQDRKYYHYAMTAAQLADQRQERQKYEKYIKLKQIEKQNKKKSQMGASRFISNNQQGGNLQIGLKSQLQKKYRDQQIKRDVGTTLRQQLIQKQQQKIKQRQQQIDLFWKNQAYLAQQFNNRNNCKHYGQNQAVYNHYRQLHIQKTLRDRQLEHKIVDQAGQIKDQLQSIKNQNSAIQKQRKKIEIKDTLQRQVLLHNYRKRQQKNANPQQANYSFLNNIFEEKKKPFNKQQYYDFLGKQAQEQRLNKLQHKFMSPQQYKFNSNQLSKALNGNYTFQHYQDRSIASLGAKNSITTDPLQGQDAQIVKYNLQTLRSKNNRSIRGQPNSDLTTL